MRFKMNKLTAAVAVTLGTSAVVVSTAQADEILFPYLVTSATVTTLVSTMNAAGVTLPAPTELHYRYFYKNGDDAENNAAACDEVNLSLPSSANDIVTFDVGGEYQPNNLNILFEDVTKSRLPYGVNTPGAYGNIGFGRLGPLTQPVRAFLVVDNNDFDSFEALYRTGESLAGEAVILEFVNGAAWGYSAYNSTGRFSPDANNFLRRFNLYDFSDFVETAGEVIASETGLGGAPVAIAPRLTATGADDIITKFFVTPIAPTRYSTVSASWVPPGGTYFYLADGNLQSVVLPNQVNLNGDLTAAVYLGAFDQDLGTVVVYDRDEGPVSGTVVRSVTCVGAVDVKNLMSEGALSLIPGGGWSNLRVGRWAKGANGLPTAGVNYTDEAVVIKLEYNTTTSPSLDTIGIVNNAIWLRKGIKESIPAVNGVRFQINTVEGDNNAVSSVAD